MKTKRMTTQQAAQLAACRVTDVVDRATRSARYMANSCVSPLRLLNDVLPC